MPTEIVGKEVLKAFITLFVIMDPIGVIPIFLGLVKGMPEKVVEKQIKNAILVTIVVMGAFIFLGVGILDFFNIDIVSFKIAGGIILLLLGIFYVLGLELRSKSEEGYDITVPIGVPLLVGPGVITTVIILVGTVGTTVTLIAGALSILVTVIILYSSKYIFKILGAQWTNIISRIMGIILAAIAVDFMRQGIVQILRGIII
tara:strand:+ start:173 stop:778 length:606 start_codon:yes stop_codon:yes gene_type:complete